MYVCMYTFICVCVCLKTREGGQIHVLAEVSPEPGPLLKSMAPGRGEYVALSEKSALLALQHNLSWGLTQRYVKIPARAEKKTAYCHRPTFAGLLYTMHVPRDRSGVISRTYCPYIQFRRK